MGCPLMWAEAIVYMGIQIPYGRAIFRGGEWRLIEHSAAICAKTAEPIDYVGLGGPKQALLVEMNIGATWRIQIRHFPN